MVYFAFFIFPSLVFRFFFLFFLAQNQFRTDLDIFFNCLKEYSCSIVFIPITKGKNICVFVMKCTENN